MDTKRERIATNVRCYCLEYPVVMTFVIFASLQVPSSALVPFEALSTLAASIAQISNCESLVVTIPSALWPMYWRADLVAAVSRRL